MDKRDKIIDQKLITIESKIEPLNMSISTIHENISKLKKQSQRPCQNLHELIKETVKKIKLLESIYLNALKNKRTI